MLIWAYVKAGHNQGGAPLLRLAARPRRLAKDYERPPITLADLHLLVFACLMLNNFLGQSP